ncbi:MAG: UDP-N-acetylglucosamine 1-carboxyvinyltransferase [Proteobacteria bacterium]|nr:UDP-N-acetylglucosamine 1-carboxyvinyltransferase [Pseudomonadota bacterium]
MDNLIIMGGAKLDGTVKISGAKNSVLPIIKSTLLTAGKCVIKNVPNLDDINVTLRLLQSLGCETSYQGNTVEVTAAKITSSEAPYRFVKALRSSFWVLGPLIARTGMAKVALPGGDAIGSRPVDLHLKGLEKLGAEIHLKNGVVYGTAPSGLRPNKIRLDFQSVGATHQIMMTAALIPGTSVIQNAACEPEIVEVANFLSSMGAKIEGAGTTEIVIHGKEKLEGTEYEVEGDRIEAATFLVAAAMTGGKVTARGISREKLRGVLEVLEESGCSVVSTDNALTLSAPDRLKAVSFVTNPYPGVATDVQPLLMAAMAKASGHCTVEERVFESRFGHVAEYRRLGAEISINQRVASITGVDELTGAPVEGLDIRAVAGLVLMGLAAKGVTEVSGIHHLDRGYGFFVEKLKALGAQVSRVPVYESREIVVGC